jgi:hypothetical protein
MSKEGEDIRKDLQEDHRAGDRKANIQDYHYTAETEWTLWRDQLPKRQKRQHTEYEPEM